jgi:DNA-binding transcriptional MerR regulator
VAKGPDAFRSISEAATELGVPQHVLRFWETKFAFVRPMKRAGGRRFYRPQDIAVLAQVRRLLHDDGLTIKGVQKLHRELGAKRFLAGERAATPRPAASILPAVDLTDAARRSLTDTLDALLAAKARLDGLLGES